jgi:hypothetical protein
MKQFKDLIVFRINKIALYIRHSYQRYVISNELNQLVKKINRIEQELAK